MKACGGRGDKEVGGSNNGGVMRSGNGSEGRAKNGGHLVNKQGQRRNVRAQRRFVPEGGGSNVTTLRSNVATFQRG